MEELRRFLLVRDHDISGVSGTGVVAEGVCFSDGTAAVRWRGEKQSTVVWNSIDDAIAIHGHGGATRIEWLDREADVPRRTHMSLAELEDFLVKLGDKVEFLLGVFAGYRESEMGEEIAELYKATSLTRLGTRQLLDQMIRTELERS